MKIDLEKDKGKSHDRKRPGRTMKAKTLMTAKTRARVKGMLMMMIKCLISPIRIRSLQSSSGNQRNLPQNHNHRPT